MIDINEFRKKNKTIKDNFNINVYFVELPIYLLFLPLLHVMKRLPTHLGIFYLVSILSFQFSM